MFDRIVVPLDGSAFAEAALIPARELAGRFGSWLLLTRAIEPLGLPPVHPREEWSDEDSVEQIDDADIYLHEQVGQLRSAGYTANLTLFIDDPGAGITEAAELSHADLIVMATRLGWKVPYTDRHRASVTLDVLARSRIPILSCHLMPSAAQPIETAPDGPSSVIPQLAGPDLPILVPLDGSPFAEQALRTAEALAQAFGAYIILVQALAPHPASKDFQSGAEPTLEHTNEGRREAREYLDRLRMELEAHGVSATTVVDIGVPIIVIEHTWREHGAGMIVMASHGQSGHGKRQDGQQVGTGMSSFGLLVGSVAAAILEELEVPTLVIQPAIQPEV